MALNSLLEHGLEDLVKLYSNLLFLLVRQTTLSVL